MDLEALRDSIPVTDKVAYFNTGASGPSPRPVIEAVSDFQRFHEFEAPVDPGYYKAGWNAMDDVRETLAAFLGVRPTNLTLTESTTQGINLIASSIDWTAGDIVVRTDVEHPSGRLPWARLEDTHGIETRVVECPAGRCNLDDFETAMVDARLICLSTVSWNFGTRLPIDAVTDIAEETNTLVLLDAVQAPGQFPVDVSAWEADFVVGSGHKWMLGPWGTGFLWLSPSARRSLTPTWIGPRGVEDPGAASYSYRDSARMFELTTMPVAVYRGLEVAVETLESVGLRTIRNRIEILTNRLKAGIDDSQLLSPREYESGLVSIDVDDAEATVERLAEAGIVVRTIPDPECIRVSVHAFNTPAEIDRLLKHLL